MLQIPPLHRSLLLPLVAGSMLAAACTPRLRSTIHAERLYKSPVRCSQGPLELGATATGNRWGESLTLEILAPRDVLGYYRLIVGGRVVQSGHFGARKVVERTVWHTRKKYVGRVQTDVDGKQWVSIWVRDRTNRAKLKRVPYRYSTVERRSERVEHPDNAWCTQRPAAARGPNPTGAGAAPGASAQGAAKPPGSPDETPTSSARRGRPGPSPTAPFPAARQGLRLVSVPVAEAKQRLARLRSGAGVHHFSVIWRYSDRGPGLRRPCARYRILRNGLRPGTPIRIQVWSGQPNDLQGVIYRLVHRVNHPSTSEKKWLAYLAKERRACLARHHAPPRARRRHRRRWCTIPMFHTLAKDHRISFYARVRCRCLRRTDSDNPCARGLGRAAWAARLFSKLGRDARCTESLSVRLGGRAHSVWLRHPCRCFARPRDLKCWGVGGYARARATFIADQLARLKQTLADRRRRAQREARARLGPPPPARRERRPPRPVTNATWVPGYWLRGGAAWHWIRGWWRVPERDVTQGRTVRVTVPPPAPKPLPRTRPPRPVKRAVWVPGAWYWDGRRFVWVRGAWRLPPSGRVRWRRAHWRHTPRGVIFWPGGWILRAR